MIIIIIIMIIIMIKLSSVLSVISALRVKCQGKNSMDRSKAKSTKRPVLTEMTQISLCIYDV